MAVSVIKNIKSAIKADAGTFVNIVSENGESRIENYDTSSSNNNTAILLQNSNIGETPYIAKPGNSNIEYKYTKRIGDFCGENAHWRFYYDEKEQGVLEIFGEGSTDDYIFFESDNIPNQLNTMMSRERQPYEQPWHKYAENITKVIVTGSITRLGNGCFLYCDDDKLSTDPPPNIYKGITKIDLSEAEFLENIGFGCFAAIEGKGSDKFNSITIPKNVYLEGYCFAWCNNLYSITLEEGVILDVAEGEHYIMNNDIEYLTYYPNRSHNFIKFSNTSSSINTYVQIKSYICSNYYQINFKYNNIKTCLTNIEDFLYKTPKIKFYTKNKNYSEDKYIVEQSFYFNEQAIFNENRAVINIIDLSKNSQIEYLKAGLLTGASSINIFTLNEYIKLVDTKALYFFNSNETQPSNIQINNINNFFNIKINHIDELCDKNYPAGYLNPMNNIINEEEKPIAQITIPEEIDKINNELFAYWNNLNSICYYSDFQQIRYIGKYSFYKCNNLNDFSIPSDKKITININNPETNKFNPDINQDYYFYDGNKYFTYTTGLYSSNAPSTLFYYPKDIYCDNSFGLYICNKKTSSFNDNNWSKIGEYNSSKIYNKYDYCCITFADDLKYYCCKNDNVTTDPSESIDDWYVYNVFDEEGEFSPRDKNIIDKSPSFTMNITNIKSIKPYAFAECNSIISIINHIKTNNNLKLMENIQDYAFYNCSNLTNLTFEGTKIINSSTSLIEITKSVSEDFTIGKYTFAECPNLQSVILPQIMKEIGEHSFENSFQKDNANIEMPKSMKLNDGIKNYAFNKCSGLQYISIPQNINIITEGSFANCKQLKSNIKYKILNSLEDANLFFDNDFVRLSQSGTNYKNIYLSGNWTNSDKPYLANTALKAPQAGYKEGQIFYLKELNQGYRYTFINKKTYGSTEYKEAWWSMKNIQKIDYNENTKNINDDCISEKDNQLYYLTGTKFNNIIGKYNSTNVNEVYFPKSLTKVGPYYGFYSVQKYANMLIAEGAINRYSIALTQYNNKFYAFICDKPDDSEGSLYWMRNLKPLLLLTNRDPNEYEQNLYFCIRCDDGFDNTRTSSCKWWGRDKNEDGKSITNKTTPTTIYIDIEGEGLPGAQNLPTLSNLNNTDQFKIIGHQTYSSSTGLGRDRLFFALKNLNTSGSYNMFKCRWKILPIYHDTNITDYSQCLTHEERFYTSKYDECFLLPVNQMSDNVTLYCYINYKTWSKIPDNYISENSLPGPMEDSYNNESYWFLTSYRDFKLATFYQYNSSDKSFNKLNSTPGDWNETNWPLKKYAVKAEISICNNEYFYYLPTNRTWTLINKENIYNEDNPINNEIKPPYFSLYEYSFESTDEKKYKILKPNTSSWKEAKTEQIYEYILAPENLYSKYTLCKTDNNEFYFYNITEKIDEQTKKKSYIYTWEKCNKYLSSTNIYNYTDVYYENKNSYKIENYDVCQDKKQNYYIFIEDKTNNKKEWIQTEIISSLNKSLPAPSNLITENDNYPICYYQNNYYFYNDRIQNNYYWTLTKSIKREISKFEKQDLLKLKDISFCPGDICVDPNNLNIYYKAYKQNVFKNVLPPIDFYWSPIREFNANKTYYKEDYCYLDNKFYKSKNNTSKPQISTDFEEIKFNNIGDISPTNYNFGTILILNNKYYTNIEDKKDNYFWIRTSYLDTSYYIPYKIIEIKNKAYFNCYNSLTTLCFNKNLINIEDSAFENCEKLRSIKLTKERKNLKRIGKNCFNNTKYSNETTNWKPITKAYGGAGQWLPLQYNNSGQKNYILLQTKGLSNINTIYLDDLLSLEANHIWLIADEAFSSYIPDGTQEIKYMHLGKTIRVIGSKAFETLRELNIVKILWKEPPSIGEATFSKTDLQIIVPDDTKEAYLNSDWAIYGEIIEESELERQQKNNE